MADKDFHLILYDVFIRFAGNGATRMNARERRTAAWRSSDE
jgi:hypothetical protein